MADNEMEKFDFMEWFESRKRLIFAIGIPAIVLIVALIVIIVVVNGKKKNNDPGFTPTPTSTPTAVVTMIPTEAVKTTPVPTAAPTQTPVATPTATPQATPTPGQAQPTPTTAPQPTPTPTPEEGKITYEQAKAILYKYSKETLNLDKEVREYKIDDSSSSVMTLIEGMNCYRFTLIENVNGKDRNRGEFYISDDGSSCFEYDYDTGAFVPLPLG